MCDVFQSVSAPAVAGLPAIVHLFTPWARCLQPSKEASSPMLPLLRHGSSNSHAGVKSAAGCNSCEFQLRWTLHGPGIVPSWSWNECPEGICITGRYLTMSRCGGGRYFMWKYYNIIVWMRHTVEFWAGGRLTCANLKNTVLPLAGKGHSRCHSNGWD